MADTIRFGLLGAGLIAPFHAKAINATQGARLAGVTSRTPEKAARFAEQFGCRAYASFDEMLADPEIDAIDIMTPNHLHAEAALKTARAGKHVLVEKPQSMTLADTDAMIAAAEKAGVKLGVILNCRVRAAVQAMLEAKAQGRFGRILQADAFMKWFRSNEYYMTDAWRQRIEWGAGVTIQQGFHYIDLLQYVAGPVRQVDARMTNLAHPEVKVEDSVQAFLEFESGAIGTFLGSTALWPGTDIRLDLNGENGTAVNVGEKMTTWKFRDERPGDEDVLNLGRAAVGTGATGAADLDFAGHQKIVEHFVRAINENTDPFVTAQSARHTLEICLAMYKSAKTKKPVSLPLESDAGIFD